MKHRDKSEFDPSDGAPQSEDGFGHGTEDTADDFETDDAGDANAAIGGPFANLERRLSEQEDKYLRLAAEYDNYRKRTARERAELTSRAQAELVKQLADALDDLARFAHVDPASVDAATIVQGVDMVEKKFLKTCRPPASRSSIRSINRSIQSCTRRWPLSPRSLRKTTTSSRACSRSATCSAVSSCAPHASW